MKKMYYTLFIITCITCISCVSFKGNDYYRVNSEFPMDIVYLNDSTAVMYFANTLPLLTIHYKSQSYYNSKYLLATVKQVDILDHNIYDYVRKRLPLPGTIREQLIYEGDRLLVSSNYFLFEDYNQITYLRFYRLRKSKIKRYVKHGICYGLKGH